MPSETDAGRQSSETRLLEIVFPDHCNHMGVLFGGQALAWMDKAAFLCASRRARRTVVTARTEPVDFRHPVALGQMVELIARVIRVGRTSMTVQVQLWREDPASGERQLCTEGCFVMVALDEGRRPVVIDGEQAGTR